MTGLPTAGCLLAEEMVADADPGPGLHRTARELARPLRPGVTAWCYGQERTSDQTDRADPSVTIRIRTGGQRWVSPDDDSRPARWRHFCTSRKRGAEILYCRHDNIFANLGMVSDAGTGHRA